MELLEKVFGIKISDTALFEKALTHPSFTQEHDEGYLNSYERLEFLGDSVLKVLSSDILYEMFPEYSEGKLSQIRSVIVSDATLAKIFKSFELENLLIIAKHEHNKLKNNDMICACAFEAILGAYYLEGKLKSLRRFLKIVLLPYINEAGEN